MPAKQYQQFVLTFAVGLAGGALFAWLGIPAPWLAGAMVAAMLGLAARLPAVVPNPVRSAVFVVVGLSIGGSVTPDSLAQLRAWPVSILMLVVSIGATMAAGTAYLARVRGWDRATARFSSIPGALSQVLIVALRSGAPLQQIALAQSLRVVILLIAMPWLLQAGPGTIAQPAPAVPLAAWLTAAMIASSAVLGLALERAGVPAGMLLGGMMVGAVLHGSGLVEGRIPDPVLTTAFVTIGCLIGARFVRVTLTLLRDTILGAAEGVAIALAISAAFALAAHHLLGLPFQQLWLAYAPGGVEAMAILAVSLGIDPAFVGAHHVVRLIVLSLAIPFWGRNGTGPRGGA